MRTALIGLLLVFLGTRSWAESPTTNTAAASTEVMSGASPSPSSPQSAEQTELEESSLPEIHGKISLPKGWTLLPGKLLDGGVLLATREKIHDENDPWTTGLTMSVDFTGARDLDQKASAYALTLATDAREKAGEEATPVTESQSGPLRTIRFEFPLATDPPLMVTELLIANDTTGTVTTVVWQMPKDEAKKLSPLREAILSGLKIDPSQ